MKAQALIQGTTSQLVARLHLSYGIGLSLNRKGVRSFWIISAEPWEKLKVEEQPCQGKCSPKKLSGY
jgi:hypothetical protein